MRSTVTNTLTSGRLSASSIRLPTYIEATKPQNTSGCSVTSCRPGRDAVDHQRADQHRGDRAGRDAERQHRHEGAGGGRVVGRFRAGDAGDRALAEFLRMLGDALLQRIGQEAGNDVRRAGNDADDEAEHGAARDRHRRLRAIPAGSATARAISARSPRRSPLWLGVDRISPRPNRPTATGTMPMPSPSSARSKL